MNISRAMILAGLIFFGKEASAQQDSRAWAEQAVKNIYGGSQLKGVQPGALRLPPVEYDHKGNVYHNPNLGLDSLIDGYIAKQNYNNETNPVLGRFWLERDIAKQSAPKYPYFAK